VLWFVISASIFFGSAIHRGLILAIVCVLFIMAVGVPYVLWRVGETARGTQKPSADETAEPFQAWLGSDFATWTGNQTSVTAAVEILLPIAAVAIGIMVLGIVWATAR
jgi:hypothetical protein